MAGYSRMRVRLFDNRILTLSSRTSEAQIRYAVSPISRRAQVAFRDSVAMGPCLRRDDSEYCSCFARNADVPHTSLALLNENDDTRRVFSSRISVRVSGGSARWLQSSRSQRRQLTPIGVPWLFSRSKPA